MDMVNKTEHIEQRQNIYDGNEEHSGTCTASSTVSTMKSMTKLLAMRYMWHIRWKSTTVSMGQIICCASNVTNFTLTLETSSPHLSPSINSQEVNNVNCKTWSFLLYLAMEHKVSIDNLRQERLTLTLCKSAQHEIPIEIFDVFEPSPTTLNSHSDGHSWCTNG